MAITMKICRGIVTGTDEPRPAGHDDRLQIFSLSGPTTHKPTTGWQVFPPSTVTFRQAVLRAADRNRKIASMEFRQTNEPGIGVDLVSSIVPGRRRAPETASMGAPASSVGLILSDNGDGAAMTPWRLRNDFRLKPSVTQIIHVTELLAGFRTRIDHRNPGNSLNCAK